MQLLTKLWYDTNDQKDEDEEMTPQVETLEEAKGNLKIILQKTVEAHPEVDLDLAEIQVETDEIQTEAIEEVLLTETLMQENIMTEGQIEAVQDEEILK